jgi:PKHD-type hydroxylase
LYNIRKYYGKKIMEESLFINSQLVYENVFTPEECEIIKYMPGDSQASKVGNSATNGSINKRLRYSHTTFLIYKPENKWLFEKIGSVIEHANSNFYKFKIDKLIDLQVLKYDKENFFDWHYDLGVSETSLRKISVILFLSKPTDYKGGKVVWLPEVEEQVSQEQGSIVIFPSFIPHIVETVEEGLRYTLVTWVIGPHFS